MELFKPAKRNKMPTSLLDIYIQDPVNNRGYLITAESLYKKHLVNKDEASKNDSNCITFVIPDFNSFTTPVPTFQQSDNDSSPIKIFDMSTQLTFLIKRDDLKLYQVKLNELIPYGISFVMPIKSSLIEELPALMRGLLQTQESPVIAKNELKKEILPLSPK